MKWRIAFSACITAAGLAGCAGVEQAPPYPTKAVRVVIPYPAGNTADVVGRVIAGKLAQQWGQPVNVENIAGRTTVPGVDSVAKAASDGYTLLIHSVSYAVDAGLYTNLPYDPAKDFAPVAPIARQPFALVASPSLGVRSVAALVSLAKSKPEPLGFASLGPTTQVYFIAEQFKKQAGIQATNVSYKSLVEANGAVAMGEQAFWFPPVAGAMPAIREGKLVPLAVTAAKRAAMLPQTPTMAEAGIAGMESAAWFGMWAPAGTSRALVNKIASEVERALAAPDVQEKLAKMGAEPMKMTPAQFGDFVGAEITSSRHFVQELGVKPQAYSPPPKQ
jgi:tripartite-type tricarboxylate transporter receptor subunit TctC